MLLLDRVTIVANRVFVRIFVYVRSLIRYFLCKFIKHWGTFIIVVVAEMCRKMWCILAQTPLLCVLDTFVPHPECDLA